MTRCYDCIHKEVCDRCENITLNNLECSYYLEDRADVMDALRLLLDWAIECDFGYDSIPDEYEIYKDKIKDMGYAEGLIYIATEEAKKNRNGGDEFDEPFEKLEDNKEGA